MLHCSLGTFLSFSFLHPTPRILFRPSNASFVRASVLPPSLLLHHCCASLPLLPSLLCSPARSTFSVTPALSFRRARVARCDSPPSRASRPCSRPCSCALPRSLPPSLSLTHTSCVSLAFPTHPLLCSVLSCSRASSLRRSLLFGCFSTPNCYPVVRTQVWDGTGPIRMPRGEAHVFTNVSALSSNCRVFCILIVLLLSVWVYVGIRVPCPAVVSTAHIGPPAPTPVAGGWSSPRTGLHACEPPRAHAAFGKMP